MAAKVSQQAETTITIVGDNRKPYDQDFVPNNKVMDKLFEYVLDRHPNFMSPENEDKNYDPEDDMVVATLKKQTKIPKAHVPTYKKK